MSTEPPATAPAAATVPRSEFLLRTGAVEAVGIDAGVAAHYGDPVAEQRELASGAAVVDLSHRTVVAVTGEDRLRWLDSMTSQELKALAPGESTEALLLNPTGRIEHALKVVDDGATTWLLVERDEAESLVFWLDSMRFMMRVEVVDRTAEYATVGTFGTGSVPRAAAPNGVALVWVDPWARVSAGGYQYASAEEHPAAAWSWRELIIERGRLTELDAVPAAGMLALEALRIAAWRPRFGTEVDERSIPHELDWLRTAVHLTKGCYRGQETVAKVHNLGHPPRRMALLHLDGSDAVLPHPGDEVTLDGAVVGRITSAARHHELGSIALATLKRATAEDAVLTVLADGAVLSGGTEVTAAQEVIVPADAGARLGNVRKQFLSADGPGRRR